MISETIDKYLNKGYPGRSATQPIEYEQAPGMSKFLPKYWIKSKRILHEVRS